ncbi:hypothetical protein TKK_0018560 [Trichogramma kaykai]|uniref:Phosphatidylinositol N-acetylglucosaminyltransferase subunit Q n=1 Tax=Trichogramma kaykai TaxID=54128 RepID=A0ABD2VYC5_9HYME
MTKSLLIFVPADFHLEAGCMYGELVPSTDDVDNPDGEYKFFVLGVRDNVQQLKKEYPRGDVVPLGYYYGREKRREYWDKKLPCWIEMFLSPHSSNNYDYCLRSVILNNQKIDLNNYHSKIILYDRDYLLKTELYTEKYPADQFLELRNVLTRDESRKKSQKQYTWFGWIRAYLFSLIVLSLLHPVSWIAGILKALSPGIRFSFLGLHLIKWFESAEWMLRTLIKNKRFTLKTTNYLIAMTIDAVLGYLSIKFILHIVEDSSFYEIIYFERNVVDYVRNLIGWLMGSPAGLKLNRPLNNILGEFFLYHLHLWLSFLLAVNPVMEFGFAILLFFGKLGITCQMAIIADLLTLVSFHTYCIYVYAQRLFALQLQGLIALFRLFLGKKKNPLRNRVDSCEYETDQLFIGTSLFTILLFLMPTIWVYYFVFSTLRVIMVGLGGFLTRLKFYLQIMPIYVYFKWLFCTKETTGSIGIQLLKRQVKGPTILKTKPVMASWSITWKKSIPDTFSLHPPIEWNRIISDLIWGKLLYPL